MGAEIPKLSPSEFASRLRAGCPEPLDEAAVERLFAHFDELRRWNPRLSLIGPGTAGAVVERHFAESLAALPFLQRGERLVDVGSGGGFPGLVLAAAGPDLEVVLVESRRRKAAFLRAVAARSALPCTCLDARVARTLPEGLPAEFDWVTCRAVRLSEEAYEALAGRLTPRGSFLLWAGRQGPGVPASWEHAPLAELPGSALRLWQARPRRDASSLTPHLRA